LVTLAGTAAQIDASLANTSYTGNHDYYGGDLLNVTTTDTADGKKATGSPAITVNPILPTAGNAQLDIAPGQRVDLTSALLALDTPGQTGDRLQLTGFTKPTSGGTVTLSNTGDLSYTAPATGTADSFTYTVTDETLETSATAKVSVTLNPSLTGNGTITLSGSGNTVDGGNGNVTVSGSNSSSNTVMLGSGNDSVSLTGSSNGNTVTLGTGNDSLSLSGNNNTVTLGAAASPSPPGPPPPPGNDMVTLSGSNDSVTLGNAKSTVRSTATEPARASSPAPATTS
jgi:hypothetical protein